MSFSSVVVAHVPDLIHLCPGRAPQERPAGGKVGLEAFPGEKKKKVLRETYSSSRRVRGPLARTEPVTEPLTY